MSSATVVVKNTPNVNVDKSKRISLVEHLYVEIPQLQLYRRKEREKLFNVNRKT